MFVYQQIQMDLQQILIKFAITFQWVDARESWRYVALMIFYKNKAIIHLETVLL